MSPSDPSNFAPPLAWVRDGSLGRTVVRRHAWPGAVGRGFLGEGLASGFAADHARNMRFIDRMLGQVGAPETGDGPRLPVVGGRRTNAARSAWMTALDEPRPARVSNDAVSPDAVSPEAVFAVAVSPGAVSPDAVSHDAVSRDAVPAAQLDAPSVEAAADAEAMEPAQVAPTPVPVAASPARLPTVRVMPSTRTMTALLPMPVAKLFAAPDMAADLPTVREPVTTTLGRPSPADTDGLAEPASAVSTSMLRPVQVGPPLGTAHVHVSVGNATVSSPVRGAMTAQRASLDGSTAWTVPKVAEEGGWTASPPAHHVAEVTARPQSEVAAQPEGKPAEARSQAPAAAVAVPLPVRSATVQRRHGAAGPGGGRWALSEPSVIAQSPASQPRLSAPAESIFAASEVGSATSAAASPASTADAGTAGPDATALTLQPTRQQQSQRAASSHAIDRASTVAGATLLPPARSSSMPIAVAETAQVAIAEQEAAAPVALTMQRSIAQSTDTPTVESTLGIETLSPAPSPMVISRQIVSAHPEQPSLRSVDAAQTASDTVAHDEPPLSMLRMSPLTAAPGPVIASLRASAVEPSLLRVPRSGLHVATERSAAEPPAGGSVIVAPSTPLPSAQRLSRAQRATAAAQPLIALPVAAPVSPVHRKVDSGTAIAEQEAAAPVALTMQRSIAQSTDTPTVESTLGIETLSPAPSPMVISRQIVSAHPEQPSLRSVDAAQTASDTVAHDEPPLSMLRMSPLTAAPGPVIASLRASAVEPSLLRVPRSGLHVATERSAAEPPAGGSVIVAPSTPLPSAQRLSRAQRATAAAQPLIALPVAAPVSPVHRKVDSGTSAFSDPPSADAAAPATDRPTPASDSTTVAVQRRAPAAALPLVVASSEAFAPAPLPTHVLMRSALRVQAPMRTAALSAVAAPALAQGTSMMSGQRSMESLPAPEERFSAGLSAAPADAAAHPPSASAESSRGAAPAPGAGVDLDELVERALQALMQRLDIERERRGFARWA